MKRKGGGRRTTEAELELWRSVMRDAEPLPGRRKPPVEPEAPKARPSAEEAPPPGAFSAPPVDFSALLDSAGRAAAAPRRSTSAAPAPLVTPLGPSTPGLDRRTAQRLLKGDKRPEARVDLHGMTQERAHRELVFFLRDARWSGLRLVLVVTGKGGDYKARASGQEERRGSLRESVPRWLSSPPLNQHVNGVYQAHERHGGGGALYVYLRRL